MIRIKLIFEFIMNWNEQKNKVVSTYEMSFESNSWYGCNEIGLCNPVDTFFIGTDISYM